MTPSLNSMKKNCCFIISPKGLIFQICVALICCAALKMQNIRAFVYIDKIISAISSVSFSKGKEWEKLYNVIRLITFVWTKISLYDIKENI